MVGVCLSLPTSLGPAGSRLIHSIQQYGKLRAKPEEVVLELETDMCRLILAEPHLLLLLLHGEELLEQRIAVRESLLQQHQCGLVRNGGTHVSGLSRQQSNSCTTAGQGDLMSASVLGNTATRGGWSGVQDAGSAAHLLDLERVELLGQLRHPLLAVLQLAFLPLPVPLLRRSVLLLEPARQAAQLDRVSYYGCDG